MAWTKSQRRKFMATMRKRPGWGKGKPKAAGKRTTHLPLEAIPDKRGAVKVRKAKRLTVATRKMTLTLERKVAVELLQALAGALA